MRKKNSEPKNTSLSNESMKKQKTKTDNKQKTAYV